MAKKQYALVTCWINGREVEQMGVVVSTTAHDVEAVADEAISKLGQKLGLDSAATANKDSIKQKVTEKAAEKALDFLKKKLK